MGVGGSRCCVPDEDVVNAQKTSTIVEVENVEKDVLSAGAVDGEDSSEVQSPGSGKPAVPCLTIDFSYLGEEKVVDFYKRPLGLTFENKNPLVVMKISKQTEADRAGVEPGWTFRKVGGVSIDGMDWTTVITMLQDQSEKLAFVQNTQRRQLT